MEPRALKKLHTTDGARTEKRPGPDRVPPALVPLWQRARGSMQGRLGVLQSALAELENGGISIGTREAAIRESHKLAGSLGTYGLLHGSEVAREIEERLEHDALVRADSPWLRARVERIQQLLEEAGGQGTPQRAPGDTGPPPVSLGGPTPVHWDPEHPTPGTVHADGATTEDRRQTPAARRAPVEAHHGRGPLARFLRSVLEDLVEQEAFVAKLIRASGHGSPQEPQLATRAARAAALAQAEEGLAGLSRRLQRIGLDRPAHQARLLAACFKPGMKSSEAVHVAKGLLELVRSLTRWCPEIPARWDDALVWVVSRDPDWRDEMGAALEAMGQRVMLSAQAHDAGLWMQTKRPTGVVAHAADPGDSLGLPDGLLGPAGGLPILVVLDQPGIDDRVRAARAGAHRVVERAAAPREIATTFRDLVQSRQRTGGRVLVVDDDETIVSMVREVLVWHGFEVTAVVGTHRIWDALESCSPHLVVTDLNMPGIDGVDLCLALRTDPRWENLSVVFLSARDDEQSLRRVFEAGADDFVPKPVDPAVLVARVQNRLARKNARMATGHLDPVTRLPAGPSFEDRLKGLVETSAKEHSRITIAVVRLDSASRLRQEVGYVATEREEARLARVLAAHLEVGSLVGRLDMDRFVVALDGMDAQDAKKTLRLVVEEFQAARMRAGQESLTGAGVSAGVAQRSLHGRDLRELMDQADAARRHAEQAGGSRVHIAGGEGQGRPVEKVDVLVVDDDPTIGHLLVETLSQKGWRVSWECDSARALKRLAGEHRDLKARVILLDVNMPGMDGLTVLRLLAKRGVVPETRVIMLTVRAREDEVVRALGLGASDHVAKPFSVPVLASRVKRALED